MWPIHAAAARSTWRVVPVSRVADRGARAAGGSRVRRAGAPALAHGSRVERDLSYGPDPDHRLDVYLPSVRPTGAIVLVVHGGAWAIGDKANPSVVAAKVAHWSPAGVVVVSVNYRLLPSADPLQQAGDLAQAIAWVQQRAASWRADPSRLVVIGHSSGAHLAALLAADPGLLRGHGAETWLATILLDCAVLDVVALMRAPHRPLFDRAFGADEAVWRQASPLHRLRTRPAPLLLVHSGQRPESAEASRRFANAVADLNGRAEVIEVGLSHIRLNASLGLKNPYTDRVDHFLKSVGLP
jgi:arylformamidase